MDQVIDIAKLNKFNFLDKEVENLDRKNRRPENKVEILKDSNDVCECIIALFSFSISKEKTDQVTSEVLSKLAMEDI